MPLNLAQIRDLLNPVLRDLERARTPDDDVVAVPDDQAPPLSPPEEATE